MANEKYIEIDPATGKAEYINKNKGQQVPAMPADKDLCLIEFKEVTILKVDPETKEQIDQPGYVFSCDPSDDCLKKNKKAEDKKKELKDKIAKQDDAIKRQDKIVEKQKEIIEDAKTKEEREAARKRRDEAKKKKKEAEAARDALKELLQSIEPYCELSCFVGIGGDNKLLKRRYTIEEIKQKKIEHLFCLCREVEVPK